MLTKHISVEIEPTKDEQVRCPKCGHLVPKKDLVPVDAGQMCVGCYTKLQGA